VIVPPQQPNTDRNYNDLKPKALSARVIVDGVYFQISNVGIARVWKSLLEEWANTDFAKYLAIVDRERTAPRIEGINYIDAPRFNFDRLAEEPEILQALCDRWQADIFMSTYHTFPRSTPMVTIVHDLLPELFKTNLSRLPIFQKQEEIDRSLALICVSNHTQQDLYRYYPHLDRGNIHTLFNGVSKSFTPQSADLVAKFTAKYQIDRPYLIAIGNRFATGNYKNIIHLFRAMNELPDRDRLGIVCVGGNPELEPELATLIDRYRVWVLSLTDQELTHAYSGAIALVYPSLYEGFGLPILEAMACGCPVITCHNSALPEVGGDAVIYIDGQKIEGLVEALVKVREPQWRSQLITQGLERASQFSWQEMSTGIVNIINDVHLQKRLNFPDYRRQELCRLYLENWQELDRTKQDLELARSTITSMESTKFWQLRRWWIELKQLLGSASD
jgi:glycosyltransferase involved in cell wall biosynthesis